MGNQFRAFSLEAVSTYHCFHLYSNEPVAQRPAGARTLLE